MCASRTPTPQASAGDTPSLFRALAAVPRIEAEPTFEASSAHFSALAGELRAAIGEARALHERHNVRTEVTEWVEGLLEDAVGFPEFAQ